MDPRRIIDAFRSGGTPLVRTDFTSDAAWHAVITAAAAPVDLENPENRDPGDDGYSPHIVVLDERAFEGVTGAALGEALSVTEDASGYALLADSRSMAEVLAGDEITLDYVDLSLSDPEDADLFDSFMGRTFRCTLSEVASVEANLSLGNMDFHEFADNTAPDGVFRGFEGDD